MTVLSVIVATHNGANTIDRTLAAMSELHSPPGGWKLIVVNNASTDDTEERVLRWKDRLPLQYLVEPRLGKSFALNTAFDRVEGDLAVLTDDDTLPYPDWLTEWRRVADSFPDCGLFGGGIIPHFDAPLPSWTIPEDNYSILYGQTTDIPEGPLVITASNQSLNAFGANLALRRRIWEGGWRFGENFLVGNNGLMGEDSDFARRIYDAGLGVGHAPTTRVRHIIHKEQLSWWWIQQRFFRHGRAIYMFEDVAQPQDGKPMTKRAVRWRGRRVLRQGGKAALAALRGDKDRLFTLSRSIAYDLGAMRQAHLLRGKAVVAG